MRKPITRYEMNIYRIKRERKEVFSDLPIELKSINYDNLSGVAELRGGSRYKEFKRLLIENKSFGIVAFYEGKIVGYGWGKLRGAYDRFYKINHDGYIGSIYVLPDLRGHNIAAVVIQELLNVFNEKYGIEACFASIENNNLASKHTFAKIGMRLIDRKIVFRAFKLTIPKYRYFKEKKYEYISM